jgi:hypothetical protein
LFVCRCSRKGTRLFVDVQGKGGKLNPLLIFALQIQLFMFKNSPPPLLIEVFFYIKSQKVTFFLLIQNSKNYKGSGRIKGNN